MKKLMFSTATIVMALSFNAFAGTPEKAEAKIASETKVEAPATSTVAMTTYYAVRIPGTSQFTWTDDPNVISNQGLTCEELPGATCVVQAESKPADNTLPPGYSPTDEAYQ